MTELLERLRLGFFAAERELRDAVRGLCEDESPDSKTAHEIARANLETARDEYLDCALGALPSEYDPVAPKRSGVFTADP